MRINLTLISRVLSIKLEFMESQSSSRKEIILNFLPIIFTSFSVSLVTITLNRTGNGKFSGFSPVLEVFFIAAKIGVLLSLHSSLKLYPPSEA